MECKVQGPINMMYKDDSRRIMTVSVVMTMNVTRQYDDKKSNTKRFKGNG